MNFTTALKTHWKLLIDALVVIAAFGGGYLVAEHRQPAKVTTTDKTTEIHHEAVQVNQSVDIDALVKKISDLLKVQKTNLVTNETKTIKKPDGTVITDEKKSVDLSETTTQTHTDTTASSLTKIESQLHLLEDSLHTEEHTKIVEAAKSTYRLGLGIGYDIPGLFGKGSQYNLVPVHGLIGQVNLERHLLGPISGAVWVQTTGVAGIGLHIEF